MKKGIKNIFLMLGIVILITPIIIGIMTIIINKSIIFKIKGDNSITLPLNSEYQDKGYTAKIFNKDISKYVTIENNIDNTKIGEQNIKYTLKLLNKKYQLQRIVNIIDNESPTITLNGQDIVAIYVGETYEDEGATAIDNYDKDISDKIVVTNNINNSITGEYKIVYTITDTSGNTNSIERKIIVKNKPAPRPKYTYNENDKIAQMIIEQGYQVSVGYYNLVTGKEYYFNKDKIYFGASLIKTVDALYLYEKNLVTDELKPYINRAISVSDNNAHKYLVDYIGADNLRNYGISLGANYTLYNGAYYGYTNIENQIIYYKKLYELTRQNQELASYFTNDYVNSLKFSSNISIMHKYGWSGDSYHDAGIVLDDNPYIIVVLTSEGDYGKEPISKISRMIYQYHKGEI